MAAHRRGQYEHRPAVRYPPFREDVDREYQRQDEGDEEEGVEVGHPRVQVAYAEGGLETYVYDIILNV